MGNMKTVAIVVGTIGASAIVLAVARPVGALLGDKLAIQLNKLMNK